MKLELKLLADIGLIGFPNVGKSTLIAAISAAKPKIADYPFTTLVPNLGVVRVEAERSFVVADIPGLIEGASEGVGLGHQFLRHVERTRLLAHVIDVSGMTGRDPLEDYAVINRELAAYNPVLAQLPQTVLLNKTDVADPENVETLTVALEALGQTVFPISAATRAGLDPLIYYFAEQLTAMPLPPPDENEVMRITVDSMRRRHPDKRWQAVYDSAIQTYIVAGEGIERMVAMTNLSNEASVSRLQRILENAGVVAKLRELGASEGDTVRIGKTEFSFFDEDAQDTEEETA